MTAATLSTSLRTATAESFRTTGYLVVHGFLSAAEVAEIRDTFMTEAADGPVPGLSEIPKSFDAGDPLARYPRMMHPHRHSDRPVGPLSLRYLLDPRSEAYLRAFFGAEPLAAQTMFYFKPPGARGQDLHQDNFYLRVKRGTCIAAWLAVDPSDGENGGLVVVPGSHAMEIVCPDSADPALFFTTHHVEVPDGMQVEQLRLDAGDMLFFNGSLIHGSYPNRSADRFRRAFISHYVPADGEEVSAGYRPLLRFDGAEAPMAAAAGGGPCGEPHGVHP